MRFTTLTSLVGAALAIMTAAPAESRLAQLHQRSFGVLVRSAWRPQDRKGKAMTQPWRGKHDAVVYRSVDDNIEYKRSSSISPRARVRGGSDGRGNIPLQDKKKLLMDTFGRVDGLYGRKLTVDQPNNGGARSPRSISSMGV